MKEHHRSSNKEKGGWRNQQPLPVQQQNSNRDGHGHGNRDRDRQGGHGKKSEWSRGKSQPKDETGWQRGKQVPLDLLKLNEGADDSAKAVVRIDVNELLALRLSYVAAPLDWKTKVIVKDTDGDADAATATDGEEEYQGGPRHCRWISESRVQEIDAMASKSRLGGDVSGGNRKKKKEETAPALEDCKPLEVNNNTRWTASIFKPDKEEEKDTDDVVLKKGLLIMNKLSLTKFEKLSDQFIDTGIGRNEECLAGAIELIVKKAQDEPHFAAMYAALCLKLSRTPMEFEEEGKKKKFKRMLLSQCQKEFETDTNYKMEKAIEGVEDEEERQLKKSIVKKHYLGHMRFIGELYKGDLISIKIMLMVLPQLLEGNDENGEVDEEKVECFAKLMAVIGLILEQQSVRLRDSGKSDSFEKLKEFWDKVHTFAGESKGATVSNRIKFMLQDLLEMRDNGWTTRREEESAKTIEQIHKDAAKEARRGPSTSKIGRSASSNGLRKQTAAPSVDADGFVEVVGTSSGGFNRSQSLGNFARNDSRSNLKKSKSKSSKKGAVAAQEEKASSKKKDTAKAPKKAAPEFLEPKECGIKAKNIFKEYFVGGDIDEAVLSIHELIGAGEDGSVARGAKVLDRSIFMVMEMKAEDVEKMLPVIARCHVEKKIEPASFVAGLNDPLEFLTDIAIDAPLASTHLATIFASFVKIGAIPFDYLLGTPQYFRTDCNAASFGAKALQIMGGDATTAPANVEVVEKLMTDEDHNQFSSAKDLIADVVAKKS